MVYLLTGSFPVGLRIPRISPILAGTGVSARLLWAMLIPVHLRGWELSLHSHPTSKTELFKPASFVSAYTLAGLSSHPGLYSLSGERVEPLHSRHSLQRTVWSSSRWQIATAVFSNAPRRLSRRANSQTDTAIGNPTCDTSWAQSMPRPVRRYPGSGSTVRARSPSRRQWWRTSSWR